MLEILGFTKDGAATPKSNNPTITAQGHGGVLASADFHGAEVEVVRCTDAGKVGIKGIVVRDTKFTFVVVTCKNELKTLPKRDTVFRYEVALPGENAKKLVFEVHGNQFEFRPADRASRKFKWKAMDYL